MKKDTERLSRLEKGAKVPSKETLNNAELIYRASGIDPYEDTPNAFLKAYESLGIDIVNRVPLKKAPPPTPWGEVVDIGGGYRRSSLGMYDTVSRYSYPFSSVEDFFSAPSIDLDYHALITPVPHTLDPEDIKQREEYLGETGVYYYQLYTTLFMWGVEYLGWEVYMMAAALDPEQLYEKFILPAFSQSLGLIKKLCNTDSPLIFCHDDLADKKGPVFRPEWYEEYIFPLYPKLWEPIKEAGKKVIFVADGNMEHFLEKLKETGIDGVMLENPATPFDSIIDAFGDGIVIGGMDTSLLTFGSPGEIREAVFRIHEQTKDLPGFALSSPGGIHGNVPFENGAAYFNARAERGYTPPGWQKI